MNTKNLYITLFAILFALASCQKDETPRPDQETSAARDEAIAFKLESSAEGTVSSPDSLYVMEGCKKGNKKEEVSLETLALVKAYLTANYTGYTTIKTFRIINSTTSSTDSYIAIIAFNGKPVAIKFDADETFEMVMELREAQDLAGRGWHLGGLFEHRDGKNRDTISINSLSSVIKSYFLTHFTSETLVYAVEGKDGTIVILSQNTDAFYATAFTASGTFVKRLKLAANAGRGYAVTLNEMPASVLTYLTATYPAFVFKKAVAIESNSTIKGYLVLIDANTTKYAVRFDATGNVVSSITVR